MVGALTICLSFGASALTYKIKRIESVVDKTNMSTGGEHISYDASCWASGNDTKCSGAKIPILERQPDKTENVSGLVLLQTSDYPSAKCVLGDALGRYGRFGFTGYVGAGDTEASATIELNSGSMITTKDEMTIPLNGYSHTWISTFLPTYVTCPGGYGEFKAYVTQRLTAKLTDAGLEKVHRRIVTLVYEPVGDVTRVHLQPDSFKVTGPVGKYIEVQTRISVNVQDSTRVSVEWPSAAMVEYENGGKWTDSSVNELTVTSGLAYRDQKIRLRSVTPMSKTISIPVTVTVD